MKFLLFPYTFATWLVKTAGRVAAAVVAAAIMTLGFFLWSRFDLPQAGIPVMIVGLLLAARAVF
jgi:hypothetical protein